MKVLEEDVEKSLQREESRLDAEEQCYPDNVQKVVQELKSKHNVSRSQAFIYVYFADSWTYISFRSNNYGNVRVRSK